MHDPRVKAVLHKPVDIETCQKLRVTVEELKNHLNDNNPKVEEVFNNVTVGK